ncbi:hypothetical protein [Ketogulonicigenium vulgare]|uniref:Uncharacterized protein n=1 Tax=Ketogulonicigenium vulgare (strain WSH-001) TaxID=759362 RepID=F9Y4I7_KETVW|nr:hypothetical protein [Ketogulonicigenium vulgare]ADO42351.1 hypothetical protein EIO_1208 [Ketogulonicigenium vulgare Y25]AEM40544.1 hypothetical protein KVU_0705 [Ketogulonicigenium vulgare WSH-001]ALJ80731.1 hypothetical protein KVH_05755 [Ketogulonicigenium vulgare]ANW34962.1 hypothetical protein KvSKV_05725 [Ketogulonicigenium vulgare]AOZ54263.1 hypothetical protein KVC_1246 [Ketogulonicigenium vulgare]
MNLIDRPFRREAHACRIDGMIKITGGAISQRQLAERLKIHRATVRSILKERNWLRRIDRPHPSANLAAFNARRQGFAELNFD